MMMMNALIAVVVIAFVSLLVFKQYLSKERERRLKNLLQVRIRFNLCSKRIISALNAIVDLPVWARVKAESQLLSIEKDIQVYEEKLDQLSERVRYLLWDMKSFDIDLDRMNKAAIELTERALGIVAKARDEMDEKMIACNNLRAKVDFDLYGMMKICFDDYSNDSNFDTERQHLTELKSRLVEIDTKSTDECLKNIELLSSLQSEAQSLLNEINEKRMSPNYKQISS